MLKPYYEDTHCTIYHGDCREILPEIPKVDLVLTDPPYGIGRLMKGGKNTGHWNKLSCGNEWDYFAPDLTDIIKKGEKYIIWGGNYFNLPPSRCFFFWYKTNSVPTMADGELAITSLDKNARVYKHSVISGEHPTQKPIKLMKWCIEQAGEPQTILDPFMGSGTTLRATKDLNRKAIGIEMEEKYCEIAVKRLAQEVMQF